MPARTYRLLRILSAILRSASERVWRVKIIPATDALMSDTARAVRKKRLPLLQDEEKAVMFRYEAILKSVSLGVIFLGGGLLVWRIIG